MDNKQFWKTIMTMFSDKIKSSEDLNTQDLSNFFSNTFKNMRIPEREEVNPFVDELSNMVLKVIFKYSKHLSIIALDNISNE